MNNYLYVDIDDEITGVIGRIRKEKSEEIFLVVPKRALVAQSLVNLRLLGKEATKLKKKLIFVSPDALTRKIAEKAGLSVKKYVAKLKEEEKKISGIPQNPERTASPSQNVPLEPWEEKAAKEELDKAIGKNNLPNVQGPILAGPTQELPQYSPTAIKAKMFAAAPNPIAKIPFPIAPGKAAPSIPKTNVSPAPNGPQVVDLKKIASDKRHKEAVLIRKKEKESKFPEEPPLKELLNPTEAIIEDTDNRKEIQPSSEKRVARKLHLAKNNPFKIKKIVDRGNLPVKESLNNVTAAAQLNQKSLSLDNISSAEILEKEQPEAVIPSKTENLSNIAIVLGDKIIKDDIDKKGIGEISANLQDNLTLNSNNSHNSAKENSVGQDFYQEFNRETANLTIRERERLKELWMEQKKIIRGKTFKDKTNLDLRSKQREENKKEELVSSEKGLFQTTHRRVVGPGKVVDLRVAQSTLATAPERISPFSKVAGKHKKKGREIILPLFNVKIFLLFVVGIILVLAIITGIILPEAKVNIVPKTDKENLELKVGVSGEISQADLEQKIIPGKPVHFKLNEEKSFPTTVEKEIKENPQGQVIIYNKAEEPLSLKQNALLTDDSGNKLYTASPITVPAGKNSGIDNSNNNSSDTNSNNNSAVGSLTPGSATVNVTGDATGKDYNLKEGSSLNIPGLADSNFAGLVTAETKGKITGEKSRIAKTVSSDDLEKAKEELLNMARQDGIQELQKNLDAGVDNNAQSTTSLEAGSNPDILSVEDMAFSSDKAEGQEADSFTGSLSVTFFTVSFETSELQNLAKNVIEKERDNKNGTVKVNNYTVSDAKPLENKMEISADLSYQLENQVNVMEIRKALVARKKQEAEDYLKNRRDIERFSINIWPGFLGHLPILEQRIKLSVEEQ